MLNRITLIGRLTRDPETKTTSTGKKLVEFSIAVNKRIKPKDGSDADFFYVKAWGQTADYISEYITKGRLISVDGRLDTNTYEKDGKKVTDIFITADNVAGLDRPRENVEPRQESRQEPRFVKRPAPEPYNPFEDDEE